MTTATTEPRTPVSVEHIAITPGVCGGKPCIANTRIRVQDIYVWHELQGQSPDEIVSKFPQLSLADVHAALTYFWDHREEILRQMREAEAFVAELQARAGPSKLQQKLAERHAENDPVSPG